MAGMGFVIAEPVVTDKGGGSVTDDYLMPKKNLRRQVRCCASGFSNVKFKFGLESANGVMAEKYLSDDP